MSALVAGPELVVGRGVRRSAASASTTRRGAGSRAGAPHLSVVPSLSGAASLPDVARPALRPVPRSSTVRPANGRLRLTARGRRVVALLALLLVGVVSLVGGRAFADSPARALEVQTYSVASGDTLWALASSQARPGEDVRDVVAEIIDLNGLASAELTVGQRLVVPVER
ncbi:LysM peptidoglycan-binding domain-containing protein [Cellulomonas hominis]